jgi:8-amino-3,8-dideoxy-alpha-D-manno-octulosonate transaminase
MRPVNPNMFGAVTLNERHVTAVADVIHSRELFRHRDQPGDSECTLLEREAAAFLGCAGAVAVNSGTTGLTAALRAAGVRPGGRVLIPAFTFVATAFAVVALGAVPEPVEVRWDLGMDLDDLRSRLGRHVQAVVTVNVQGHASNASEVAEALDGTEIPLVEDACQGFGASSRGRFAGTVGLLGVFSFQQSKQLAAGEGGLIIGRDPAVLATCARAADLGAYRRPDGLPDWDSPFAEFGENLRMTELQAAILRAQLHQLPGTLDRQRASRRALQRRTHPDGWSVVRSVDPSADTGSHLLLLAPTAEAASRASRAARTRGVLLRTVWDRAYYQHALFTRHGLAPGQLRVATAPRAEDLARRLLSVPLPPTLAEADLDLVADVLDDVTQRLTQGSP